MKKLTSKDHNHSLNIEELYKQELQSLHEKISKQAARDLLEKLQPSNKITVEQLFLDLKQHKQMWEEISGMGALDFLCALLGERKLHVSDEKTNGQRTRLTNKQIESLHVKILQILNEHRDGLNRKQISSYFSVQEIKKLQIDQRELFDKLRIPLSELLNQGRIYSQGNKRLLKYFPADGNKSFEGGSTSIVLNLKHGITAIKETGKGLTGKGLAALINGAEKNKGFEGSGTACGNRWEGSWDGNAWGWGWEYGYRDGNASGKGYGHGWASGWASGSGWPSGEGKGRAKGNILLD